MNYEDIYIPKSFTIGTFSYTSYGTKFDNCAFPTYKDNNGKWQRLHIFKRLTGGYAPHEQRDSRTQMIKDITQNVVAIDNTPVAGIKLCKFNSNIYSLSECEIGKWGQVVLQDPRGFYIGIGYNAFLRLMEYANWTMDKGVFGPIGNPIKIIYGWVHGSEFVVISENDPEYQKALSATKTYDEKYEDISYITERMLKVGEIYKMFNTDTYVRYIGKSQCYSSKLHRNAYKQNCYTEELLEELTALPVNKDVTGVYHVFYQLEEPAPSDITEHVECPYYIRKGISKQFIAVSAEEAIEANKMRMHNSTKLATLENIKDDMTKSLLFNKLKLNSNGIYNKVRLSVQQFKDLYVCDNKTKRLEYNDNYMRFMSAWNALFNVGNSWCRLCIYHANPRVDLVYVRKERSYSGYYDNERHKTLTTSIEKFVEDNPCYVYEMTLENGHVLPLHISFTIPHYSYVDSMSNYW